MGRKPAADTLVWEDNNLVFPLGDAQVAVSLMPGPIPWSSLEGPCATAPSWPEAAEAMRRHKYQLVVAVIGGTIEAVERRVILTRLVGAVASDTDAVGVYWGEGTLVHEPKQFVREAKAVSADDIRGRSGLTCGLRKTPTARSAALRPDWQPLGFLEIEIERATVPPEELMGFVGDTACYVVNRRLHIRDGETMGRTPTEQYKVRMPARCSTARR